MNARRHKKAGKILMLLVPIAGVFSMGGEVIAEPTGTALHYSLGCAPAAQPLPEDSLGTTCTVDGDCPGTASCIAGVCYVPKNRYVSLRPIVAAPGCGVALRVSSPGCASTRSWVQSPTEVQEPNGSGPTWIAPLGVIPFYTDAWPVVVHVGDIDIVPEWTYEVRAILAGDDIEDPTSFSDPVTLPTATPWGDVVGSVFDGETWDPPNGITDFNDITAVTQCSQGTTGIPLVWCDLAPCIPDGVVDQQDIDAVTAAFQGAPFPECEPDCQPNGIPDDCDLADGTSQDCNCNGIPDECEVDPCGPAAACCLPDSTCQNVSPNNCTASGGTPFPGSFCDGPTCGPPGACCIGDQCSEMTKLDCESQGGFSIPNVADCFGGPCTTGSCCLDAGECMDNNGFGISPAQCSQAGGAYIGGAMCALDDPCAQPEACCIPCQGACVNALASECAALGGSQGLPPGTACTAQEACCLPDGRCEMLDPACCEASDGIPPGPGTSRGVTTTCANPVSCCLPDGGCEILDLACCLLSGGTETATDCLGDCNGDGVDDACSPPHPARPMPQNNMPPDGQTCMADADCMFEAHCVPAPEADPPAAGTCYVPRNRYLSVAPNPANAGTLTARRIQSRIGDGPVVDLGWVGPLSANGLRRVVDAAARVYADWAAEDGPVTQIADCEIQPGDWIDYREYWIDAILEGADISAECSYSEALKLRTNTRFGDVFAPPSFPPDGVANIADVFAEVQCFQDSPLCIGIARCDLAPQIPNGVCNLADAFEAVHGFQFQPYPYTTPPENCP